MFLKGQLKKIFFLTVTVFRLYDERLEIVKLCQVFMFYSLHVHYYYYLFIYYYYYFFFLGGVVIWFE